MEGLMARYAQYEADVRRVREKASAVAGLFGMGEDPRKDPCHMTFYEDVEKWVAALLGSAPAEEDVYRAAEFILSQPAKHTDEDVYWFMYAAQGLCGPLIPLLNRDHAGALLALYDREYPKRERLPVHRELYRLLKKGAK